MAAWNIINTLDNLVIALCLDYERRKNAIASKLTSYRTDTEYRYLNYKIFSAACEIAGERDAEIFINDIGKRVGYANTECVALSEVTYKRYKNLIKENIAKKLHLTD